MRRVHILVFDDELVHRPDFLGATLTDLEHRLAGQVAFVLTFRPHADFALSELAALSPDAVFMDFHMGPHADGATAVAAIRGRYARAQLPILAISSDARMNQRMLAAGACQACVKMALPDELPFLLPDLVGLR
jgi:CheY-like chemotaxis protein